MGMLRSMGHLRSVIRRYRLYLGPGGRGRGIEKALHRPNLWGLLEGISETPGHRISSIL